MKRIWISLNKLQIFDDKFHIQTEDGWEVNQENDGQSKDAHLTGIAYIRDVLLAGAKVLPILALDNGDGTYTRLDGFKRCLAHYELGYKFIEAFVVSQYEFDRQEDFPNGMKAYFGGQFKEKFPLFEGNENPELTYDDTVFLYKSPNSDGLRIEIAESIHVHWGAFGKYRLTLGKNDFIALAKAFNG